MRLPTSPRVIAFASVLAHDRRAASAFPSVALEPDVVVAVARRVPGAACAVRRGRRRGGLDGSERVVTSGDRWVRDRRAWTATPPEDATKLVWDGSGLPVTVVTRDTRIAHGGVVGLDVTTRVPSSDGIAAPLCAQLP